MKKGRKRCERNCIERREQNKTDEFCTKKEKRKWRQKWRWSTRDCGSLKSNDRKRCKKDKKFRQRQKKCMSKKIKSGKYYSEKSAWLSCFNKK